MTIFFFAPSLFARLVWPRSSGRARWGLAVALIATIAAPHAAGAIDHEPSLGPDAPAILLAQAQPLPPTFEAVLQFVRDRGWRANLDRLCAAFDMPEGVGNCTFKQVSIQDEKDRGYPRAFNVSDFAGPQGPYVLIFHLNPLAGEFFIVSTQGELVRAFYRAKGRGYDPMPTEDVQTEFKADLEYWLANLDRLKALFDSSPPPQGRP